MSSITPTNPGVSDLLQILSSSGSSSLSSVLSSSKVQSALQKASPADIVQLSDQALQLQVTGALFGSPDSSQPTGLFSTSPTDLNTTLDNILTALSPPSASQPASAASPAPSLASQLAAYQGQLQSDQLQALFGTNTTAGISGTSVNLLA